MAGFSVELHNVTRRYQGSGSGAVVGIDDITLMVDPGDVVAVAGPSGSGKSTLLHVIGAMDAADEGTIVVGPYEVTGLKGSQQAVYRRSIGFVFQRFHLLPALTALDNVQAPLIPFRTEFDRRERALELLAGVGLAGREGSPPFELSGGQQQRVAIARALINEPGLLLADEPTGNIDSDTGAAIMQLLLDLNAERGMTILVATHDPVIATSCRRIVRLSDGRIIEDVRLRDEDTDGLLDRISGLGPDV